MCQMDSRFTSESERLKSLKSWPLRDQFQEILKEFAKAGFYYEPNTACHDRTELRCFVCRVVIHDWTTGDDPWKEHVEMSPRCLHMLTVFGIEKIQEKIGASNKDFSVTNPGIQGDFHQRSESFEIQVCGEQGPIYRNPQKSKSCSPGTQEECYYSPGGIPYKPARNPSMSDGDRRRQSFLKSNLERRKTDVMAEAGFYFDSQCRQVRCYYCEKRLNPDIFGPETNPWYVHASVDDCFHVILSKGEEFLKNWGRYRAGAGQSMKRRRKEDESAYGMEDGEDVEETGECGKGSKIKRRRKGYDGAYCMEDGEDVEKSGEVGKGLRMKRRRKEDDSAYCVEHGEDVEENGECGKGSKIKRRRKGYDGAYCMEDGEDVEKSGEVGKGLRMKRGRKEDYRAYCVEHGEDVEENGECGKGSKIKRRRKGYDGAYCMEDGEDVEKSGEVGKGLRMKRRRKEDDSAYCVEDGEAVEENGECGKGSKIKRRRKGYDGAYGMEDGEDVEESGEVGKGLRMKRRWKEDDSAYCVEDGEDVEENGECGKGPSSERSREEEDHENGVQDGEGVQESCECEKGDACDRCKSNTQEVFLSMRDDHPILCHRCERQSLL